MDSLYLKYSYNIIGTNIYEFRVIEACTPSNHFHRDKIHSKIFILV